MGDMGNQDRTKSLPKLIQEDGKTLESSEESAFVPEMDAEGNVSSSQPTSKNEESILTTVTRPKRFGKKKIVYSPSNSEGSGKDAKLNKRRDDVAKGNHRLRLTQNQNDESTTSVGCERCDTTCYFLEDNGSQGWNLKILTGNEASKSQPIVNIFSSPPGQSRKRKFQQPLDSPPNSPKLLHNKSTLNYREYPGKNRTSEPPICQMCQRILSSSLDLQPSDCLDCPFICYSKFPTRESLRWHIIKVHLICGCRNDKPHAKTINIDCPLSCNCPICDEELSVENSLQNHVFSVHDIVNFSDRRPPDEPAYLTVPQDLFTRKCRSTWGNRQKGRNGSFICDICAIKFSSVRDLFHHFNKKNHTNYVEYLKTLGRIPRELDADEPIVDLPQSSLKRLRNPNEPETCQLSPKKLVRGDPELPTIILASEECDAAMEDYLLQIKNHQERLKSATPDDSLEDYREYEYLELDDSDESPKTVTLFSTDSSELPEDPKDPPPSSESILESLLTPDITATDSTASEESKFPSITYQTSQKSPRKSPKIIQDSRTFDEKTLLYLEKLQKDHKSLIKVRSMLISNKHSTQSILDTKPDLKIKSLKLPPDLVPLPSRKIPAHETEKETSPRCPRCKKLFDSAIDLAKHRILVRELADNKNPALKCVECHRYFQSHHILHTHKYLVHNDDSGIHICDNCCKILTTISMVNDHQCITVPSFNCKTCIKTFESSKKLLLHNQAHHLEGSGPHSCPICQKNFLTESMMTRHMEDICSNNSKMTDITENNNNGRDTDRNLVKDTSKLHRCNVCQYLSATSEELLEHLEKIHALEACKLCSKVFGRDEILHHIMMDHLLSRNETEHVSEDKDVITNAKRFVTASQEDIMISVFEYSRYEKHSQPFEVLCLKCLKRCPDTHSYQYHNAEDHDPFCILCNQKFDQVSEAFKHKNEVHQSVENYIWVVSRILLSLSDFREGEEEFMIDLLEEKTKTTQAEGQQEVVSELLKEKMETTHEKAEGKTEIVGDSIEGFGGNLEIFVFDTAGDLWETVE
ncbi:uncharacterized protein LOC107048734 [Diachasma alloeum]|uniref:uncharacterized protein LOC107048734 n=1 Tax=Diachasma alloeum TaxID=454923 RepID=UPI00073833F0|nr:uncharacterized protein LOC107048734 [Diachasma alloeum]XP_015127566.1 uncharacterized protein LOC107048734 [Diachasma alloeum]